MRRTVPKAWRLATVYGPKRTGRYRVYIKWWRPEGGSQWKHYDDIPTLKGITWALSATMGKPRQIGPRTWEWVDNDRTSYLRYDQLLRTTNSQGDSLHTNGTHNTAPL